MLIQHRGSNKINNCRNINYQFPDQTQNVYHHMLAHQLIGSNSKCLSSYVIIIIIIIIIMQISTLLLLLSLLSLLLLLLLLSLLLIKNQIISKRVDLKKYANKISHLWTAKNFPKIVKVCTGMTECVKRH